MRHRGCRHENPGSLEVLGNGEYGLMPDDSMFGAIVARVLADEPQRVTLAGRGLRRAAEFSLDAMVGRYEDLLMELAVGACEPSHIPLRRSSSISRAVPACCEAVMPGCAVSRRTVHERGMRRSRTRHRVSMYWAGGNTA